MTTADRPAPTAPLAWLVELFQANGDAAFNVAFRLVWNRSDAEDVVQSSFVKAARSLGQLRDPDKARSWLLSITYRESLAVLRRRRDIVTDPVVLRETVGLGPGPEELAVQKELADAIRVAIDGLPTTLRTAFVLRDVEEVPMAAVAEILGIGNSAAKMRVARAREMLRVSLIGRI